MGRKVESLEGGRCSTGEQYQRGERSDSSETSGGNASPGTGEEMGLGLKRSIYVCGSWPAVQICLHSTRAGGQQQLQLQIFSFRVPAEWRFFSINILKSIWGEILIVSSLYHVSLSGSWGDTRQVVDSTRFKVPLGGDSLPTQTSPVLQLLFRAGPNF